jgi:NADH:ubiquinone reductase (non-electrogenic)
MAASSLLRSLSRISRAPPTTAFYHHHRAPCSPFSSAAAAGRGLAGLGPTGKGEKARVVVLGTGWAGSRLMKDLDTGGYDVVCVSPRNHMVFTPLLASTCVGTLEFRSVAEPLARIQPAVSSSPGSYFLLARCTGVDPDAHTVSSRISGILGRMLILSNGGRFYRCTRARNVCPRDSGRAYTTSVCKLRLTVLPCVITSA